MKRLFLIVLLCLSSNLFADPTKEEVTTVIGFSMVAASVGVMTFNSFIPKNERIKIDGFMMISTFALIFWNLLPDDAPHHGS